MTWFKVSCSNPTRYNLIWRSTEDWPNRCVLDAYKTKKSLVVRMVWEDISENVRFVDSPLGICVCNICVVHSCLAGPAVERILNHSFALWPNWKQLFLLKNTTLILHRNLQAGAPFESEAAINMIMGLEKEASLREQEWGWQDFLLSDEEG